MVAEAGVGRAPSVDVRDSIGDPLTELVLSFALNLMVDVIR